MFKVADVDASTAFTMFCNMLRLQDELNQIVDPNWYKNIGHKNWRRAIWLESAELMESLPWKWWKKTEIDPDNVLIELVDIWHFIMSLDMVITDQDFREIISGYYRSIFCSRIITCTDPKETIEWLVSSTLTSDYDFVEYNGYHLTNSDLCPAFASLCEYFKISVSKLYKVYMAKHALNKIRQEFGSKDGSYFREWYYDNTESVEDNRVMLKICNTITSTDPQVIQDECYNRLWTAYIMNLEHMAAIA